MLSRVYVQLYVAQVKALFILLCLVSILLIGCTHNKSLAPTTNNNTVKLAEAQPKVYFFTFNITRDSSTATTSISLLTKKMVEGKVKDASTKGPERFPNYLELLIYNGNSVVKTVFVEHPLIKRVDVYNENGSIKSARLNLTTAEFSIRVGVESAITSIIIKEYITKKLTYETAAIPIN